MEEGAALLNKQREASLGQLGWSDECSLKFGEHRTDRRGSEWTERQGEQLHSRNVQMCPVDQQTDQREGGRAPESGGERLCPAPEFPCPGKHGVSKRPTDVGEREALKIHHPLSRITVIIGLSPFSPPQPQSFLEVRKSSFWVGEELISKDKPTIKPSPSAGFLVLSKKYQAGIEGDAPRGWVFEGLTIIVGWTV